MEASFKALHLAMTNQIRSVEAECHAVINAMRAENSSLRRQLSKAEAIQFYNEPRIKAAESKDLSLIWLDPLDNQCQASRKSTNGYQTDDQVRQQSRSRSQPCAKYAQPLTPPSIPEQVAHKLCVTPSGSNRISSNTSLFQVPRQLVADCPLSIRQVEDGKCSPKSTSVKLGFANIVEIIALGGKDIIENNVPNRWGLLYAGITIPKQSRGWLHAKTRAHQLHLRPYWTVARRKKVSEAVMSSISSTVRVFKSDRRDMRVGSIVRNKQSCLQPCTVHPDHKLSWLHVAMQGVIIFFDVIDFPMAAFHSGETDFAEIMLIVSTVFWTWDLLFSFLQGYHSPGGVVEMRPTEIARNYIKHWFCFDILVVAFDWLSFVWFLMYSSSSRESRLARATKFTKFSRIARGGRIFRLAKTGERLHALLDASASAESVIVFARILSLVVMILLINHYVACAWYAVGVGQDQQETWVRIQMIEQADLFDKYFYSLHWALTQFTPCTNNIAPANATERFFASVVVLFALVVFSAFLSSLTTAIMQIKKLNVERYTEEVQIRDFLYVNKVPLSVANRVWHFFRKHYRLRSKIVQESDVVFFGEMPKGLRRELRTHVYVPTLTNHRVIKILVDDETIPMGPMLCGIVSTLVPTIGHDVFLEGDAAANMFFFVSGAAVYSFYGHRKAVLAPDCISEAVLWLKDWQHPGRLTVTDHQCELLLLDADQFTTCIDQVISESLMRALRKYASLFAQHLEDAGGEILRRAVSFSRSAASFSMHKELEDEDFPVESCSDLPFEEEVRDHLFLKSFPFRTKITKKGGITGMMTRTESAFTGYLHGMGNSFTQLWSKLLSATRSVRS